MILQQADWVVTEATNGQDALESITRCQPSLILLDLLMPVMDGFQVVTELQKHQDWKKIPVVVVSAKDLTKEDLERLQGQVTMILQKGSFSRDDLVNTLREIVTRFLTQRNEVASKDG